MKSLAVLALALLVPLTNARAGEAPTITSLSDASLTTSGRLLLYGTGFGAETPSSQVLIDGQIAIAATWTPTEIHAYVPAGASFGSVPVQVVTAGDASNVISLQVVPKTPDGRIRWRFQVDDTASGRYVTTAPNGTIYLADWRHVYALDPQGELLWIYDNAPDGGRPITVLPDGRIMTGFAGVQMLHPDGTLDWEYQPLGIEMLTGPNVGPDGNIYALSDGYSGSHGIFSLDTDGNLRFNKLDLGFFSNQGSNSAIQFTNDAFFAGFTATGVMPSTWVFEYDGDVLWSSSDLLTTATASTLPRTDPAGRLISGWGQTGMMAVGLDMELDWFTLHPDGSNVIARPVVDSDGVIYSGDWLDRDLWALNPDGSTRWVVPGGPDFLDRIGLSPDESLLITGENEGFGFAVKSFVRGYSTDDGSPVWEVVILPEDGLSQFVSTREPGFSPDGQTAYELTQFVSNDKPGYVYAIDTTTGSSPWTDLGHSLAGSNGNPTLVGAGSMVGGDAITVTLSSARESAPTTLVVGFSELNVSFKGGVMVPQPALLIGGLVTDPTGTLVLGGTLPGSAPSGFTLVMQPWISDSAGPSGLAAGNGLMGTTP